MLLEKTAKARTALQAHRASGLDLDARRILILSDGRRPRGKIAELLGTGTQATIDRLLLEGYLVVAEPAPAASTTASATVTGLFRAVAVAAASAAAREAVPAAPAGPPAGDSSETPRPPSVNPRRSLAATRMYMVDMLQLQRNPDAAALKRAVQLCNDPDELIGNVLGGLAHLRAVTNPSYGQRVAERLAEVLPEAYLPRLQAADAAAPRVTAEA